MIYIWGCSSAGRAPALQAGGQEFDSPHLHQIRSRKSEVRGQNSSRAAKALLEFDIKLPTLGFQYGLIAQLVRACA